MRSFASARFKSFARFLLSIHSCGPRVLIPSYFLSMRSFDSVESILLRSWCPFSLLSFSSFVGFLRWLWFVSWSFSCFMSSIVTSPPLPASEIWVSWFGFALAALNWGQHACPSFLLYFLWLSLFYVEGARTFPVQNIQSVGIFQYKYSVSKDIPSTKYSASNLGIFTAHNVQSVRTFAV